MAARKGKWLKIDRRVAASLPFFDDFAPEVEEIQVPAHELVETACRHHVEQGGLIVAATLGAERVMTSPPKISGPPHARVIVEPVRFEWRAADYTSPMGALLDGRPCGYDWLADFVKALPSAAGQPWAVGFIHAFDGADLLAHPHWHESNIYHLGVEAGHRMRREYILRKGVAA